MTHLWEDLDKIEHITSGNLPGFAYNSAGHVVLTNDTTIDHGFNHDRKMVHYYNPEEDQIFEHHQMDFSKKSGEHPIHSAASLQQTRSTDYGNPADIINTQQEEPSTFDPDEGGAIAPES